MSIQACSDCLTDVSGTALPESAGPVRRAGRVGICAIAASVVALLGSSGVASAQISGFNFLNPAQWKYNQSDGGSPASVPDSETVVLTNGSGQIRSIFYRQPQAIGSFRCEFTLNVSASGTCPNFAFIVQMIPMV